MVGFRWARTATRAIAGGLAVLPALALGLAVLVDRAEDGSLQPPWFALALFASDPFAWTCLRNSLILATTVTAASLLLGVGLGAAIGRRRSWGSGVLRAVLASLLAASPACLALGIVNLLDRGGAQVELASWRAAASGGLSLESGSGLPAWGLWLWTTLPASVALVALATAAGMDRVGSTWVDAARLSGAGRLGTWRRVAWPLVRARAARAAAIVFPLALLEPGAPLILGLRRTLAYQIVESAARPAPFPRVAVWTAMAAVVSFAARWMLRWWGGPPLLAGTTACDTDPGGSRSPSARASAVGTSLRGAIVAVAAIVGWFPVLGLIAAMGAAGPRGGSSAASLIELGRRALESPVPRFLVESLRLGVEVGAIVLAAAWMLRPEPGSRLRATLGSRLVGRFAAMPPLAQGVGILALPGLLAALASGLSDALSGTSGLAAQLTVLAGELDAGRNPRQVLAAAVVLSVGGRLLSGWRRAAEASPLETRSGIEAALLAGVSRRRARGLAALRPGRWIGAFLLAALLASTNLAPALLFTSWADVRTVGPGLLELANRPGDARHQATALALGLILANLAALGVARLAPAPPPEWDGDRLA